MASTRQKIGVIGAGAVGCYYGGLLLRAGHDVTFVGRQPHVDAINAHGLLLDTKTFKGHLPAKAATPNGASAGAVATTNPAPAPPAGAKMVTVPDGGSLWKIAEKFAADKKLSIPEMMKLIVAANPDKLKSETSILAKGWQLIIPE